MAKRSDSGCAPLIIIGVIVFAISKCTGGTSPGTSAPQGLLTAPVPSSEPALTTLYVQTRKLNCRAEPKRKSAIVSKFASGDQVNISTYSGDWALIPQNAAGECWVARQNLAESAPQVPASAVLAAQGTASRRSLLDHSSDGPTCGSKWKCGQMDSCEEAYHYLNQCGLGRLDGDGDGVPCESIC